MKDSWIIGTQEVQGRPLRYETRKPISQFVRYQEHAMYAVTTHPFRVGEDRGLEEEKGSITSLLALISHQFLEERADTNTRN